MAAAGLAALKGAWKEARADNVPLLAAGVAFYLFLALFPALIAAVLVYGLVSNPDDVEAQVQDLGESLPEEAQTLLTEQMTRIADTSAGGLGIGLAIAVAAALWSASAGAQGLMGALNFVYDEEEGRGFVKVKGLALLITLGGIVFVGIAVALLAVFPAVVRELDLGVAGRTGAEVARWALLVLAFLLALAVIYWVGPDRKSHAFRWITLGAVIATALWILASAGFAIFADTFGSYGNTYGSLAGVVVLMLWFFLTAYAVLFGAEVNAASGAHRP